MTREEAITVLKGLSDNPMFKLMSLVRENKNLKAELRVVKRELTELKSKRSWELSPDRMGK